MYETERGGRKREHKNVDPNETGKETPRGAIPTEAIRWARWWIPPSHQIKIFLAKTLPHDYHKPSFHRYRTVPPIFFHFRLRGFHQVSQFLHRIWITENE